jgi:exonuclease SbcC
MKTLEDFVSEEAVPAEPLEDEPIKTQVISEPTQGFIIKEIDMKGFMRYIQKTSPPLSFPHKFTVITGKTGSGKTSILDAVTFALYKRTSRTDVQGIKISDVCRPGGYVRVLFTQSGEEYEVERGFTSKSSPYLALRKNSKNIEGNIKELEKVIEEVIGLDYDGFRNSTFVRQEEMKGLGAERGAVRLSIFQKLFRLETFEKAEAKVSRKLDVIKREIRSLETELKVRGEHVGRLPQLEGEMEGKKAFIAEEKKKLTGMSHKLEKMAEDMANLAAKHDEYTSVKDRIASLADRLHKTIKKLTLAQTENMKVEPLKKTVRELEESLKDYDNIHSEGERLRELQNRYQGVKRDLDRDMTQMDSLNKEKEVEQKKLSSRIAEYEKRIARLSTTIDRDEAFDMLRKEGSLSERVKRIGMELKWLRDKESLVRELKLERKEAEGELKELKEKASGINEDSFVLSEIEVEVERTKKDMEEILGNYTGKLEATSTRIKAHEVQLKELGFGEPQRKRISEIRHKITDMQHKREELQKTRKKLEDIGDKASLIAELESRKVGMEHEQKELEHKVAGLKGEEEKYMKVRQEQEKARHQREALLSAISGAEGEIKRLKSQMDELKGVKKQMAQKEEELGELKKQGEIHYILKEKVFHRRGIVMFAINQLLPQLSLETSANLSDLTDGRFSKVRLSSYEENNRYGISIAVAGPDSEWHDVLEFSGGEKTQINAALRFAIAKELASMPQVGRTYGRMKTLFIDEGDLGSLDTEVSRQLFVRKLFSMGEFFEKIILITHLSEVAEQFPGRIMVYMTPEQESKIQVMD